MPHIPIEGDQGRHSAAVGWIMTLFLGALGGITALVALYFMTKRPGP
jgi:hypothetical protein